MVRSWSVGNGVRGHCERHELPLDARGECELCRLDAIPSRPPPSRATSWIVVGGAAGLVGGALFAFGAAPDPNVTLPQRGVPTAMPPQHRAAPLGETERPTRESSKPDRPASIPLPPRPATPNATTAPTPPRPPTQPSERSFTEEVAREALSQVRIEMYATTWCGSCRRAREYLGYNGIPYTEYDIDADEDAEKRLAEINPRTSIPTFQIDDIVQIGFSPESLEDKLNQAVKKRLYQ